MSNENIMHTIFNSLKWVLKYDEVSIDNNVFRLYYKATVLVLLVFSLVVTSRQYIGDPINCVTEQSVSQVVNTYCWIYSTFTIPNRHGTVGENIIKAGVASFIEGEDEVKYHKYYQWVCFVLFFQAMLFYVPHFLWKIWEGGCLKLLVSKLNEPVVTDESKTKGKKIVIDYFTTNLHSHNYYAIRFFICEVLNLTNVVFQVFFIDYFLGGEFSTYGSDVLKFIQMAPEDRYDPMEKIFPKITKCIFHNFGSSGSIQKFDGLCLLPINIVNEKIFIFLWFWFHLLISVSVIFIIYRITIFASPSMRLYQLQVIAHLSSRTDIQTVSNKCKIGDWFLLYQMGKNMNPHVFKEVLKELAKKLDGASIVKI